MSSSIGTDPSRGYGLGDDAGDMRPAGQDVLDAAYTLAYRYPGGVPALAARMGTSYNTLKHKLNPNNDTHHLTLREALAMQVLSGRHDILHAMADALDEVCTPALPDTSGADPLGCIVGLHVAVADLSRALADPLTRGAAGQGGAVSKNEMRRAEAMGQQAIAAIGHALAMLRALMRAEPVPSWQTNKGGNP